MTISQDVKLLYKFNNGRVFVRKKPKREKRGEIRGRAILDGGCSTCVGEHEEIPTNVHYVITRQRRHRLLNTEPRDVVAHIYLPTTITGHMHRNETNNGNRTIHTKGASMTINTHTRRTTPLASSAPHTATTNNEIITSKKHTYACHMWNAYDHMYK